LQIGMSILYMREVRRFDIKSWAKQRNTPYLEQSQSPRSRAIVSLGYQAKI